MTKRILSLRLCGSAIRGLRKQAGMSLGDVAGVLGWDKARVSKYENNHLTLSIPVINQLARALKVSPEIIVIECIKCCYPKLASPRTKVGKLVAAIVSELDGT